MRTDVRLLGILPLIAAPLGCTLEDYNRCTEGKAEPTECAALCRSADQPPAWCARFLDAGGSDAGVDGAPEAGLDGGMDGGMDASPCAPGCEGGLRCDRARDECVQCTADGGCGDGGVCAVDAGQCVECLEDEHCPDPAASRCDEVERRCASCVEDEDCAGRPDGLHLCDTGGGGGVCVECTGTRFEGCDGTVCDSVSRTCTGDEPGTASVCEACVSDAHCQDGQLCVPMRFPPGGDAGVDAGRHCLWKVDAGSGPEGDCINVRPHVSDIRVTSIDGETATVCSLAVSTCQAHRQFRNHDCTEDGGPDHSQCGIEGQEDARCARFTATTYRCTVPCNNSDVDCPSDNTCDTATGLCDF